MLKSIDIDSEIILKAFAEECKRAEEKHPHFADDIIHASAILNEEAGELTKAALDYHYKGGKIENLEQVRVEAIQVGAMALRLLLNLEDLRKK